VLDLGEERGKGDERIKSINKSIIG